MQPSTTGIDRYAVIGNPVSHSKSPQIHAAFAAATGQSLEYTAILAPLEEFPQTVAAFRQHGGRGLNITLPFKQPAVDLCDQLSERARRAGAVNTISFNNNDLYGENTDGVGLLRDLLDNLECKIDDRAVLILGAGGAARGIIDPLFDAQPGQICIANRSLDKARLIADAFKDRGHIKVSGYPALAGQSFDLVINATSLSLSNELPPLPAGVFKPGALAYDMMYANRPTCFMDWAMQAGASRAVDGLGMLVEQAAEAFYLWRGVRPETLPVQAMIRQQLG